MLDVYVYTSALTPLLPRPKTKHGRGRGNGREDVGGIIPSAERNPRPFPPSPSR